MKNALLACLIITGFFGQSQPHSEEIVANDVVVTNEMDFSYYVMV